MIKGIINEEKALDRLDELYNYLAVISQENALSTAIMHEIVYLESLLG